MPRGFRGRGHRGRRDRERHLGSAGHSSHGGRRLPRGEAQRPAAEGPWMRLGQAFQASGERSRGEPSPAGLFGCVRGRARCAGCPPAPGSRCSRERPALLKAAAGPVISLSPGEGRPLPQTPEGKREGPSQPLVTGRPGQVPHIPSGYNWPAGQQRDWERPAHCDSWPGAPKQVYTWVPSGGFTKPVPPQLRAGTCIGTLAFTGGEGGRWRLPGFQSKPPPLQAEKHGRQTRTEGARVAMPQ